MDFRILGCVFLIVGTCIGAGMLALPIATAQLGFFWSLMMLFACWAIMTAGAFLLLEVNLWLPLNSNLISMAGATAGPFAQILTWISYLLLLYSLLCAYIAGGSDLFHNLLLIKHVSLPVWLSAIIFTGLFGLIVYSGIRSVDYTNRLLIFIKFGAFILLVAFMVPFISAANLSAGEMKYITSAAAFTVTITSFGYSSLIPSLRIYLKGNVKKLHIAILIGSLIPLICYIAWDAVIMGVIPLNGDNGLLAILHSNASTSQFVNTLSATAANQQINFLGKIFTSVCVLTSFFGVSLCVIDFLSDGLNLEKKGGSNIILHLAAYIPPLAIVLFYPNAFIKALEYAGLYCLFLLILLPAWMVWMGRYRRNLATGFRVPGGKPLLAVLIIFSLFAMVWGLMGA